MSGTYGLPIDDALPALRSALAAHARVVLQAPPGAGKSTVVPLALLDEPWARGKRLIIQEPRRLAARAVAERMATTLRGAVGEVVGLRMRLDTRVSRATRIEVVTEGVLTRMLQEDPALDGVAAILFDEFHERSLAGDLALALALDAATQLGTDTRLLVMSATLDGERIATLLGDAPIVTSAGRRFPVEVRYVGRGAALLPGGAESPERAVAQVVLRALQEEAGDTLVFLPGVAEIRRVESTLLGASMPDLDVRPLHGDLPLEAQQAALLPSRSGRRRIVLATNIAETSLTIECVRIVVDSGLARRAAFDPATGMSRLETRRISRASAEQRAGRAGRLEPGICYRVWSEGSDRSLAAFTAPEIVEADLAPLALELAAWGAKDAVSLRWLDPPPEAMLSSARDLLHRLEAIDSGGRITPLGQAMARLPAHPRLAHMLLRASGPPDVRLAAELAALLSERDLLRGDASRRDADIASRLAALRGDRDPGDAGGFVDRGTRQRARQTAAQYVRLLERSPKPPAAPAHATPLSEGILLAFAYPDRIARRRAGGAGRYTLANGRGAQFVAPDSLASQEFIVAVDLDDRDRDARIRLAVALDRGELEQHFAAHLTRVEQVAWDERDEAVAARSRVMLDELVIDDRPLPTPDPQAAVAAMLDGVRRLGLAALPWDRETRDLQARMRFVRGLARADLGQWPDVSDESLTASLESWLAPFLQGVSRRSHLMRVPLADALGALLDPRQRRQLEELAPCFLTLPTGSRVRIDYQDDNAPCVAVRLQEVFGEPETPRVAGGTVPVTFKLLSPAQRPLQITRDLASFWRNAYLEVRKDMRGRYPRHHWPENPLEAAPTRGARRPRRP